MKFKTAKFLKSCSKRSGFPVYSYPEFAFIGRSNVGKSSLINMLLNRKNLVKTGAKPGVTRTINFFTVDESISIADLPGFGYAKLPRDVKEKFLPLIREYITRRENLKLAFLLMDIRRTPDSYEREFISLLTENRIPVAIVLTKCDKLTRNRKMKNSKVIEEELGIESDSLFFTSSKSGEGKREILSLIKEHAG
jgi:GTP-binding protein